MKKTKTIFRKFYYLFFMLFLIFISFSQTTPTPDGTPQGAPANAQKTGPPPPPDAPIDNFTIPLLVFGVLLAFYTFKKKCNERQIK